MTRVVRIPDLSSIPQWNLHWQRESQNTHPRNDATTDRKLSAVL